MNVKLFVSHSSFECILNMFLIKLQEPTKKPRNPTPVTNPDRGSHYLKKSPSPTGAKDPPSLTSGHNGTTLTTADEYLQRKAMLTCGQQVNNICIISYFKYFA